MLDSTLQTILIVSVVVLGLIVLVLAGENRRLRAKLAEKHYTEEELRDLLTADPLTGLHNRRYIDERLANEVKAAERYRTQLSVLMCDLDRFKEVNERHGREFGDRLLKHFARVAQDAVRGVDAVCRYGGERFLVILPNTDATGATQIAERLHQAVGQAEFEESTRLTISIGIASFQDLTSPSAHSLVEVADWALYQAKQGGRNQIRSAYRKAPSPGAPDA